MRVLMAASEVTPYAKTGGLADVAGALPRALSRLGHQVDVVMPAYRGTPTAGLVQRPLRVPLGNASVDTTVSEDVMPGVRVVLLHHAGYFDRHSLYGEGGSDYDDNPERFAFLARGALEWACTQPEPYDVVHAHDWQTGLVPVLLRHGVSVASDPRPMPRACIPSTTSPIRASSTRAGCLGSGSAGDCSVKTRSSSGDASAI